MTRSIQIRVDESLIGVFGDIGKAFADRIKKDYNLTRLDVPYTLASQILAGKYKGQKMFNFKVRKTSLTTGVLELE